MRRLLTLRTVLLPTALGALLSLAPVTSAGAQRPVAASRPSGATLPTQGGQAAFATIQEIAKLLSADPRTDWSKVNLEKLRLHLIDMDLVTMGSQVVSTSMAGGAEFTVRGTPAVAAAIKRMTASHMAMVDQEGGPKVVRTELADGVRLLVTARNPADANEAAKIRGLGFIGLMTSGDHHQMHHLMMARGDAMMNHGR